MGNGLIGDPVGLQCLNNVRFPARVYGSFKRMKAYSYIYIIADLHQYIIKSY